MDVLEPLTISVCYSYLSHSPWEVRRSKALLELVRYVQGVWVNDPGAKVPLLRRLWRFKEGASALLPVVASRMLQGLQKFKVSHSTSRKRRRR